MRVEYNKVISGGECRPLGRGPDTPPYVEKEFFNRGGVGYL